MLAWSYDATTCAFGRRVLRGARDADDCRLHRLLRGLQCKRRGTMLLGGILSLWGPQGWEQTLNWQARSLIFCMASTQSCQENPPWRGARRGIDRSPRERWFPDDSRIPRGNYPRDRRPVGIITKARIPWAAARAIYNNNFSSSSVNIGGKAAAAN